MTSNDEALNLPKTIEPREGLQAVLNTGLIHYERLPMLEVVFERLIRLFSSNLRNFTPDMIEVSIESMTSKRYGDYLQTIPPTSMLSVFSAQEWDNQGVIVFNVDFIYTILDMLLGGRRGVAPISSESRSFTSIERGLMLRIVDVLLKEMKAAFSPICSVEFQFDRLETSHRFVNIVPPSNVAYVISIRVDIDERSGIVEVILPYATIEPIRDLLLQSFMGEKFGRDAMWESHLAGQLWETEVTLDVILEEFPMELHETLEWKEGSQILLNTTTDSPVFARCAGKQMFVGHVGKKGQKLAFKIDNALFKTPD